ncbi:ATP-binding cassette domain-containing protein [Polaromonas sp. P1-6]|nr:ATP-binding cassette domain-containing protein [Polaromonas sp. P1-6]
MAVDRITFDVQEHEVFGIVGPNGAGKSTLFNLIAGVIPPSSGRIEAFGQRIDHLSAHKRCWLGVGRTFQAAQLFPTHTVETGLLSAGAAGHRGFTGWLRPEQSGTDLATVGEMMRFIGLAGAHDLLPSQLTNLQQQKLAIGMALATGARLLLLDEPSGGLIEAEVFELLAFIRQIRDRGITVVVIDHKMRLMMELCDRIMVMSAGQEIALGTPKEITANERVQDAYLGRPLQAARQTTEVHHAS